MKILQVVHSTPLFSQAGTEIYAYNLSLHLSNEHEVCIFSRTCDLRQRDYEVTKRAVNGMKLYLINNTFRDCDSFQMLYQNDIIDRKFESVLEEVKPDVVHIHHLIFLSTGIIRIIKNKGIPIVFTLHDYWPMCPKWHVLKKSDQPCEKFALGRFDEECRDCLNEMLNIRSSPKRIYNFIKKILPEFMVSVLKKRYFSLMALLYKDASSVNELKERQEIIRHLLEKIDLFLAPSKSIRNKYIEFGIPEDKIKLSRYGINKGPFSDLEKNKSDKLRFAFVGTILPAKGVHVLIQAFNGINSQNAGLMIYGDLKAYTGFEDYLPYLRKIQKNGNIKFMGGFDNRDIASIFQNIDILVVPAVWPENNPLVIQESFLAKTPVVASRIGGIPELVDDGVNGFLFNPADTQDLHKKIKFIIDNSPDIIEKFKDNMPKIKSIEENTKEMAEIYAKIK